MAGITTVYPRVGGGTYVKGHCRPPYSGLSPRGRGNPASAAHQSQHLRSIPAWAGEPGAAAIRWALDRVYPRVGGGTGVLRRLLTPNEGLSPRGRGNRLPILL